MEKIREGLTKLGSLKFRTGKRGQITILQSSVRRYLPHFVIGATIAAVMMGSYASVAFAPLPTTPKASWTSDPLVISFTAKKPVASGSATDSLACSPSAGFVQLLAKSSNPAKMSLSTSPLGLSCGSIPTSVTITATCLVPSAQCKGSYTGQIQVRQPSNYRNLSGALKVLITVT